MRTGGLGPPLGAGHWEQRAVCSWAPGCLTQGSQARPNDRYPDSRGSKCQRGPEGHREVDGQVAGQLRWLVPLEAIQGEGGKACASPQPGVLLEQAGPAAALPFLGLGVSCPALPLRSCKEKGAFSPPRRAVWAPVLEAPGFGTVCPSPCGRVSGPTPW